MCSSEPVASVSTAVRDTVMEFEVEPSDEVEEPNVPSVLPATTLDAGMGDSDNPRFCSPCMLRVQGCLVPREYAAVLRDQVPDNDQGQRNDACGLCLGLLERAGTLQNELSSKLLSTNFEGESVHLTVMLSHEVKLREQFLLGLLSTAEAQVCVGLEMSLMWVLQGKLADMGLICLSTEQTKDTERDIGIGPIRVVVSCSFEGNSCTTVEKHPGYRRKRQRLQAPVAVSLERLSPLSAAKAICEVGRAGFSIKGKYLKFSRRLSQSRWLLNGKCKGEGSVEEIISNGVVKCCGNAECTFHAEGREDMDVRMLGGGRSFVLVIKNARRISATCDELATSINTHGDGAIEVRQLRRCKLSDLSSLQQKAESHKKVYACICWSQKPFTSESVETLNSVADQELLQRTPLRVLHRRATLERPRTLHWLAAERIDTHYFRLRLCTQAGTYIKEFVHGDFGRTRPSLKEMLGCQVDILQLDVEDILNDDSSDGENAVIQQIALKKPMLLSEHDAHQHSPGSATANLCE